MLLTLLIVVVLVGALLLVGTALFSVICSIVFIVRALRDVRRAHRTFRTRR